MLDLLFYCTGIFIAPYTKRLFFFLPQRGPTIPLPEISIQSKTFRLPVAKETKSLSGLIPVRQHGLCHCFQQVHSGDCKIANHSKIMLRILTGLKSVAMLAQSKLEHF